MHSKSRYFKQPRALASADVPAPLSHVVKRIVRFNEVDPLNIVWHGHYASYFEDARVAFGNRYGLNYQAMHAAGVVAPIKQLRIDYEQPLRFEQECAICAILHWNDAARLDFEYVITDSSGVVVTRGCTVQLFLNLQGELSYAKPEFYEAFCGLWRKGELKASGNTR